MKLMDSHGRLLDTRMEEAAAQADQARRKERLAVYIEHHGLPPMVDGPQVEHFNALELAAAIEQELVRSVCTGLKKIELRMDLQDAFLLAKHLKGEAI